MLYEPDQPANVADLDSEELYQSFIHSKRDSGGLDGWTPEDFTLISRGACALVCLMVNEIEKGTMQWPKPTLTARAASMAKDPTKLEDPLKYRVLTVLSVVYRKWASLRFKNLDGWIQGWEIEEPYTVKGGAQAAWWVTALELEHLNCQAVSVTGGSADLTKAFDEIQRDLLYELLRKGGFPERFSEPILSSRKPSSSRTKSDKALVSRTTAHAVYLKDALSPWYLWPT